MVTMTESTAETAPKLPPIAAPAQPAQAVLESWVEFNRQKYGVRAERVRLCPAASGVPAVEAVYILNARGRIWKPPISFTYLPIHFVPTPTISGPRLERQWLEVGTLLAEDMRARGLAKVLYLPPEVTDARPWQWSHFEVGMNYTYRLALPVDPARFEPTRRRRVARAAKAGFRCERVTDMAAVHHCLQETERRQGFSHHLTLGDLELARAVVGDDAFRCYVCYAPNGEPAAATSAVHAPGHIAQGWVVGSVADYLSTGATQELFAYMFDDLAQDGAVGFDFCGAGDYLQSRTKAAWGADLVPFYTVDGGRLRGLLRYGREYWALRRKQALA